MCPPRVPAGLPTALPGGLAPTVPFTSGPGRFLAPRLSGWHTDLTLPDRGA